MKSNIELRYMKYNDEFNRVRAGGLRETHLGTREPAGQEVKKLVEFEDRMFCEGRVDLERRGPRISAGKEIPRNRDKNLSP